MRDGSSSASQRALILVVERDPHVRTLERYFLEEAGYEVEFVGNGLAALQRARALMPRIIITEILVPGMDGLKVCRRLKTEPLTRSILVLILSILAAEDRAHQAGADAFLRKPLNDVLLVDLVRQLLARSPLETSHDETG